MKRKHYDSEADFERDRRRMWANGWAVVERVRVPLAKPRWIGGPVGNGVSGSILVLAFAGALYGLARLIWRTAPAEELVVTYAAVDDKRT